MKTAIAISFLLGTVPVFSGAAHAAGFTAPEGCTAFMTVQARGCRVSHFYQCEKDPAGDQWRVDYDQDGMFFLSRIDDEGQWIESYDVSPPVKQTLDEAPDDPASFSELLGGRDDYDFHLSRDNGEKSHVSGYDKLTGATVVIDGITLQQTEFDYTERDAQGTVLRRSRGNEYINAEWRLFFSGPSEFEQDGAWLPIDGSPKQFIFPGEKGYLSNMPIFDCEATMSSFQPDTNPAEAVSHDDL